MLKRALVLILLAGVTGEAGGQSCPTASAPIFVGSEWEQYMRAAQVAGAVGYEPWTVRAFGPKQLRDLVPSDTTLPWRSSHSGVARWTCRDRLAAFLLSPRAQLIYNSGFPLSFNDGAIWAGRGLTAALSLGGSAVAGPVTVSFAPVAFSSQNADFTTAPNGLDGKRAFADWRNPGRIDLPQRFGSGTYSRFDLGQSTVRLDLSIIAAGISTANMFAGPAYDHPIILGNNAAGFPHLFLGSSKPIRIWRLGSIHGRMFWGKLSESEFSPLADSGFSRLGSGVMVVFMPGAIPGLEIGGTRFFHVLQREFALNRNELLRPFGAFLLVSRARQTGTLNEEPDNQLSSVFARLVLPNSGVELYGEFGREDRNLDMREFFFFLDHDSAYLLGLRKLWRSDGRIRSVRAEVLNSRVTHLALSSPQDSWYVHSRVLQGHTQQGQALGSLGGYGGGASTVVVEQYDRSGRWRAEWQRVQLAETREPAPDLFRADVMHIVGASALRFGRRADIDLGVAAIYEYNRYFQTDAFSIRTMLSLRPGTSESH